MNQEHFRKLERMYLHAAPINVQHFSSTSMTIQQGKATVSLKVTDDYFHALGALHGSVYFKLLDDAAFFAVNSLVEDAFVLTTNFNTHLIRPVSEGTITSVGEVKFASRNLWIAESSITDDRGREIGFGTGHFARSKVKLTPAIGYL
jgi:uncharacterized protein (TIGR00369 family)